VAVEVPAWAWAWVRCRCGAAVWWRSPLPRLETRRAPVIVRAWWCGCRVRTLRTSERQVHESEGASERRERVSEGAAMGCYWLATLTQLEQREQDSELDSELDSER